MRTVTLILATCSLGITPSIRAQTTSPSSSAATRPAMASLLVDTTVSKIALGSCAKQGRPQPIWDAIVDERPDLFLFLGDNIYADTEDMDVMRRKYEQLASEPGFQKLRAACPILATWDDHDFGRNDAGAEYPKKKEAQQTFLDFFGAPAASPRRTREGVYDAVVIGPEGRRVQIVLLDTRYHRSPLKKRSDEPEPGDGRLGKYIGNTDPGATVLGESQWSWLEQQLRMPAEVRVVASSIQLIADEHGFETWGNFPAERSRFGDLLTKTGAAGVIVVSGDRHSAELSILDPALQRMGCKVGELSPPYPLIDLTTSALNQPRGWLNERNRHRVGNTYFEPNYGVLTIDWKQRPASIELCIRDEKGKTVIRHRVGLDELQPPATASKPAQPAPAGATP